MAVTWLHVSDFHLSDNGPYNQEVILRSLVESVKRFRENEELVPDLIFATGDIARQGNAKEYEFATEFFDALLTEAGLNRDRLLIVPGNHDVDRNAGEFLVRTLSSEESADRYFSPDKLFPHLTHKFHAFSEWYNDFFRNIRSFPTNTTCSPVEFFTIRDSRIAVLPLNSALFSIDDHDHGKLFIGRRCLDAAKMQLKAADLTIALVHHPLDWLSSLEQTNIETVLEESVDLLLQGHFHQASAKGIASADGEYLKLAAGAAWQTRQYPKSAMYATFDHNQVTIFPIRYEDKPKERWTLDPGLFPPPSYTKSFSIQRGTNRGALDNRTQVKSNQRHEKEAERYRNALKEELGYIKMLGMPGVESIKVNLNNDTFVPLRLSDRHDSARPSFSEEASQENGHILYPDEIMKRAFHDQRGQRMLLIIGDPGAGKTTLLKYYALCAIEDSKRLGFTIPVNVFYLPLRDLIRTKDGHFSDSLPMNLANWSGKNHLTIKEEIFNEWLHSGVSLVLLDGLDEISSTTERVEVCRWIDAAWQGFPKVYFVVTCRFTGYNKEEGVELEADYERADVQDFTPEQQECFLRNWFTAAFLKEPCEEGFEEASWQIKQKAEAAERTIGMVAHLKEEKNKGLRQLAAVPMILQIMAILWKDRDYMPENRVKLYDAALDYLLEFRDKRRKIKPLLSATRARQVLAPVSLWMQEKLKKDEVAKAAMHNAMQKHLDTLDDPPDVEAFCDYLVNRAGLLVESSGNEYRFRHKSFREYLAGFQLMADRPYDQLNKLVIHFGEEWWEEPLRFFIGSVDADVFNDFMEKLFGSPQSESLTTKQQLLLETIIKEAKGKKVDALCKKLLDPATSAGRQKVILDCLKTINKIASLNALQEFRAKRIAKNDDVASLVDDMILDLGGQPLSSIAEKFDSKIRVSFRNPHEYNAEYILIPGGSYIYPVTEEIACVPDLYVAKYPVTNKRYRSFMAFLQAKSLTGYSFREKLQAIAKNNIWDNNFEAHLMEGNNDLVTLFRSSYNEDRKFSGDDQPVVGITWYAAQAYALWLTILQNKEITSMYRIPSDIERVWVAGGRQGTTGENVRKYPWPDEKNEPTAIQANFDMNVGQTTPVNRYPDGATPEGLYDMAGNVWEWIDDWYAATPNRVVRGGSWAGFPEGCWSARRGGNPPDYRSNGIGFRIVFIP
jgi:formylglycine-generating enzyme required for sulfatase activity/UDP-2,3-diacylglucosamine pyrophosphatase LpxH/energy-coupling factor transporter ATP-binding protein EcfA2